MKYFKTLALIVVVLVAFVTRSRASATDATAQLSATMNEFVTILVNTPVAELRQTGLTKLSNLLTAVSISRR